ncbi:MAG: NAD-dependent epimerase/dehydratase family protein [Planctomycetota bacterium]|nr:NAD-dependent epimerase/dehydratase family protein [Planctomycetota bacterium]
MDAPDSAPPGLAPAALIVGCGYVGQRVARALLARGVTVFGTTRSPVKARALADMGVRPLLVSVTERLTFAAMRPAVEAGRLDLLFLVPPGRATADPSPRDVLLSGIANLVHALDLAHLRRAVLASSTAVYGQVGNVRVDADTPAQPGDDRGRLLLEAERQWLAAGPAFHVARLAGLYGPGRIIGLQAVREQSPIVGDPQAMLNLLQVDDAASLLVAMLEAKSPGRVELGCDDRPATRLAYYRDLARRLGVPAPAVLDDATAAATLGLNVDRLRRSSSKICDNAPTRQRTGWAPSYPDFAAGLTAAMADE